MSQREFVDVFVSDGLTVKVGKVVQNPTYWIVFSKRIARNFLIRWANILLAYRAEFIISQPIYNNHGFIAADKSNRASISSFLTPFMRVNKFHGILEFCQARIPPCDVSNADWGRFEHRWFPVVFALEASYMNDTKSNSFATRLRRLPFPNPLPQYQ